MNDDKNQLFLLIVVGYFTLGEEISTRDKDGIKKTFSGLMKIIFPNNDATEDETKELLMFSMEGRKRVKDQLLRIDTTFNKTKFVFFRNGEQTKELPVQTLEEIEFKDIYSHDSIQDNQTTQTVSSDTSSDNSQQSIQQSSNTNQNSNSYSQSSNYQKRSSSSSSSSQRHHYNGGSGSSSSGSSSSGSRSSGSGTGGSSSGSSGGSDEPSPEIEVTE